MKKWYLAIMMALMALGCADNGGSSGGNSAGIAHVNFDGTWVLNDLSCHDGADQPQSYATASGYTDTLTISGSSFSSLIVGGGCTINYGGSLSFSANKSYSRTILSYSESNGVACSNLRLSLGTSDPLTPVQMVATHLISNVASAYNTLSLIVPTVVSDIGFLTAVQDSRDSSYKCYQWYTKQ